MFRMGLKVRLGFMQQEETQLIFLIFYSAHHIIAESTAVYAGTEFSDSFMIYHDALTLLRESNAREYISN